MYFCFLVQSWFFSSLLKYSFVIKQELLVADSKTAVKHWRVQSKIVIVKIKVIVIIKVIAKSCKSCKKMQKGAKSCNSANRQKSC